MFTIAYGNAFDGVQLIGVFTEVETAAEWADLNLSGPWDVVEITPLDVF